MRKLGLWCLILLVSMGAYAAAEESELFTIRNGVTLGMTREEVAACEQAGPSKEDGTGMLYLGQKAAGEDATVFYRIVSDVVASVSIYFDAEYTDPNAYIDDFNKVDAALIEEYGTPSWYRHCIWAKSMREEDKKDYGQAIQTGQLRMATIWELDTVLIIHAVMRMNDIKITHAIEYDQPLDKPGTNNEGI